jgi:hypothetical protein
MFPENLLQTLKHRSPYVATVEKHGNGMPSIGGFKCCLSKQIPWPFLTLDKGWPKRDKKPRCSFVDCGDKIWLSALHLQKDDVQILITRV